MSQYKIITLSYWISTFCEGAARIIIPLYFASMGLNATKIALLFVIFELFGLITSMNAGFFINRFGYRIAFLIALLLHSIASWGYLGIGYGPLWASIILINSLRGTRGIAKELIKTTSTSYLRHIPKRKHAANILIGGKDTTKGLGLLTGSILLTYFSFKFSFFVLGILTLTMLIIASISIKDFREIEKISYNRFFSVSNKMIKLASIRALLYAGRDLWIVVILPIYLTQLSLTNTKIGLIIASGLTLFGVIQPLTSIIIKSKWIIGRRYLKRKWTYESSLTPSMISLVIIPILFAILPHTILTILLCVISYNIFAGIATTPHNFLHIKFARRHRASIDISFYKSISLIGKITAIFLSGILFDKFGIKGCLYTASICLLIGCIVSTTIPPK